MTVRCAAVPDSSRAGAAGPPTAGALRCVRGAVVGVAATALAGLGHLSSGGGRPSERGLALVVLAAVAAGVWLSNRRWTTTPLLVMLLGAQAVFHVAFGGMGGMSPAMSPGAPQTAMDHLGPTTAEGLQTTGTDGHGMVMSGHQGVAMLAAHLLAAMVTALLLRRGEDWCWRLLDLLTRPVRAASLRPSPLPTFPGLPGVPAEVAAPTGSRLLRDVAPRRGPPTAIAG